MKKVLKVMWRLLPWYLAIRGLWIWTGMALNRLRHMSDTKSMREYARNGLTESALDDVVDASETLYTRVDLGWKWFFSKE